MQTNLRKSKIKKKGRNENRTLVVHLIASETPTCRRLQKREKETHTKKRNRGGARGNLSRLSISENVVRRGGSSYNAWIGEGQRAKKAELKEKMLKSRGDGAPLVPGESGGGHRSGPKLEGGGRKK